MLLFLRPLTCPAKVPGMATKQTGDLIAVMANTVAEARHALTVPEQRLILWLIAQIDREDDVLREHKLSVLEFAEILGGNNNRLYDQMEAACKQLNSRVLEIRTGPKTRVAFHWMQQVQYLEDECSIALQFHINLEPVLLQLRERFCQIPIRTAFQLRSGYAIRWLEMLHSRQHQRTFYLTVEELRDWLHIEPGELQRIVHLNQRAIDYPRKELDAKSPLTFTSESKKVGRKVVGWKFTVIDNKPKPVTKIRKPRTSKAALAPPVDPAQQAAHAAALREFKAALAPGKPLPSAP
ncbi:MAG: repB [Verrucomicrobiales bacterium]|nr:repB [Verrucomicrobiales bacterium]